MSTRARSAGAAADPSVRLFAVAGALAAGALLAEWLRPNVVVAASTVAVSLVVVAAVARARAVAALLVAVCAAFALAGVRLHQVEHSALWRAAARNTDAVLDGRVLDEPEVVRDAMRFTLAVSRAQIDDGAFRVRERVQVRVRPPPERAPAPGDVLRVRARLRSLFFPGMDGLARRAAETLERHGVSARALVSPPGLERVGRARTPLDMVAARGRAAVRTAAEHVPSADRALLLGVTIGDTSRLDPDVVLYFRATGLSHVVAVSGANVAFVLAFVGFALRLARAGPRTSSIVLALVLLAFMAIARFEPSVLRAGAMSGIGILGVVVGARRRALVALAAAAVVLIARDPFVIHEPGLQLSALATLGLLLIAPRVVERLPPGRAARAAAVSIGAQLAVAPLVALEFHQLSLVAVAANLLVVPMVAPATVAGLLGAMGATVWRPLGFVATLATPALAAMRFVARAFAQIPYASVTTPSGIGAGVLAAAFAAIAVGVARGPRGRPRVRGRDDPRRAHRADAATNARARAATNARVRAAPGVAAHAARARGFRVVVAVALVATSMVWARAAAPRPLGGLVVTMLDVGQGDAFVVRAGGHTMMIDGGSEPDVTLRALRALGVHRIDLLAMTHPHADHITGLAAVAARYPVGRALDPYIDDPLPAYADFVRALASRAIPRDRAVAGTVYRLGPAEIDVLWPPLRHLEDTPNDVNNNSVVLRIRYGAESVLFAGEVQEEGQQRLLEHAEALRADVVKVSHHGSARMLPEFYAATRARVALIPVGPNTFGHPTARTLLALRGMRVLRSDRNGTVSVGLDGARAVAVRTARAA
jgi:competence protein ComEC